MYHIWQIATSLYYITYCVITYCVFSSLKQAQAYNVGFGAKKNNGMPFCSSLIKVFVYNCISTIIIIDICCTCCYKELLWLFNQLSQPQLSSAATTRAECHHPVLSAVLSTLSTDCWDLNRNPALTEGLLAGNFNCLWFSCVWHKTTRVAALTCQRVINARGRETKNRGCKTDKRRGEQDVHGQERLA